MCVCVRACLHAYVHVFGGKQMVCTLVYVHTYICMSIACLMHVPMYCEVRILRPAHRILIPWPKVAYICGMFYYCY